MTPRNKYKYFAIFISIWIFLWMLVYFILACKAATVQKWYAFGKYCIICIFALNLFLMLQVIFIRSKKHGILKFPAGENDDEQSIAKPKHSVIGKYIKIMILPLLLSGMIVALYIAHKAGESQNWPEFAISGLVCIVVINVFFYLRTARSVLKNPLYSSGKKQQ